MPTDHLGFLPAQADRRLLRRAADIGRTEPLWAGGPRILSDPKEIAQQLRSGTLTKHYPRALATQRTEDCPALRRIVDSALFLLDPPDHSRLRAALNTLHNDPDLLNSRVRSAVVESLNALPIGQPLEATADVGVPAALAVVSALFNVQLPSAVGAVLARTARALNRLAALDMAQPPNPSDERAAREVREAVEAWPSSEGFMVGSSREPNSYEDDGISTDRYIDLIQFLAATAIETTSTTVIASLAAGIPPEEVRLLFDFATTAPLLPYTLQSPQHEPIPVLLNISHAHPFGIGPHHCVGANIAKLVAETTLSWAYNSNIKIRGELNWHSDLLGRSLHGTLTLTPRR